MKKIQLFYILFILSVNFLTAQNKLVCKVLDVATKQPIVYATVMLQEINRGTHADFNGNFEIPMEFHKNGVIKISSIGYKTKAIKLASLKLKTTNTIYLETAKNVLNEIVIRASKKKKRKPLAVQIVKEAIENILENYPVEPHSYIGYYRDYQQPVDNSYQKSINSKTPISYLNVNEAIIESFDDGFDSDKLTSKKNQSLLYSYSTNNKFIQDNTLTIPYDNKRKKYSENVHISPLGGNELNILDLTNTIRNYNTMSFSFSNIFSKDFVRNHKFRMRSITYADQIPLYEISFFSLKEKTNYNYVANGKIYIAKKDFAIHKINYNLYHKSTRNPQYTVTIEYKPLKDKMYLNYITFNNFFEATNNEYFRVYKTILNTNKGQFNIFFNRQVDKESLEPFHKNFKIYYKNQKLKVTKVFCSGANNNRVTVALDKKSLAKISSQKEKKNQNYAKNLTFEIKNIRDVNGFEINERPSLKINQYREFFVQEVFENKRLPVQINFIDKSVPLSQSKITDLKLKNRYWLNTPLKSSKN